MRYWLLLFVPFLQGCAQFAEHADTILSLGQKAKDVAPTVSAFNPEIGLVVGGVSVLLLLVGKILKKKGKK